MIESINVIPALAPRRALTLNSAAAEFADLKPAAEVPAEAFDSSFQQQWSPEHIEVYPLAEGEGAEFLMRVLGWVRFGNNVNTLVWIGPILLAELQCKTGCLHGPAATNEANARLILPTEFFCKTITSDDAKVISSADGKTIASARVPLRGCQKIQFDFSRIDQVTMNAIWSGC